MEKRTFHGKTLDEAIRNACEYFEADRSRLEIDIIEDAKAGLFGIVGAHDATVKACLVGSDDAEEACLSSKDLALRLGKGDKDRASRAERPARRPRAGRHEAPAKPQPVQAPVEEDGDAALPERAPAVQPAGPSSEDDAGESPRRGRAPCGQRPLRRRGPNPAEPRERRPRQGSEEPGPLPHDEDGAEPRVPFGELDKDRMVALATEAATRIVGAIVGDVPVSATVGDGRVDVVAECGDGSGLLIGREGQTLAAVQYLLSRIVSVGMAASVHVQLNSGDYRERQDERLKELAQVLAERVRATGRACSTRPLSSYHRRIIHMALQDVADIQTRSSGDGAMKRVIVQRRKSAQNPAVEAGASEE